METKNNDVRERSLMGRNRWKKERRSKGNKTGTGQEHLCVDITREPDRKRKDTGDQKCWRSLSHRLARKGEWSHRQPGQPPWKRGKTWERGGRQIGTGHSDSDKGKGKVQNCKNGPM